MYFIEGYDAELIGHTTPESAGEYLLEHGFELVGEVSKYKVYSFSTEHEVIVATIPKHKGHVDYIVRMDETIKKVSEVTGLTIQEILRGMMV